METTHTVMRQKYQAQVEQYAHVSGVEAKPVLSCGGRVVVVETTTEIKMMRQRLSRIETEVE